MKNKRLAGMVIAVAIAGALALSGCGKNAEEENTQADTIVKNSTEDISEESVDDEADSEADSSDSDLSDDYLEDTDDEADLYNETDEEIEEDGKGDYLSDIPYIIIEEKNYDVKEDDVYYLECRRPVITADSAIEDYSALAESVKQYSDSLQPTQEYIDENVGYAKEDLEYRGDDYVTEPDIPCYSDTVEVTGARVDDSIVSLKETDYVYTGGAHGEGVIAGATFDAVNGQRLKIKDVFDDYDGFLELFKTAAKEQALAVIGQDGLFDDYEQTIDDLDPSVMDYDAWYLDAAGFTYTFSDYEIAPHAAGLLSVSVDYETLTHYIKSDYLPSPTDRIALTDENERGCMSLVNGDYVTFTNESADDGSSSKATITIGPDSKLITDDGYISDAYLMSRNEMNYFFINYVTSIQSDKPRNNYAVLDITDGMKIIYEESDAKIDFSSLDMDTFTAVEDSDGTKEERSVELVLGE